MNRPVVLRFLLALLTLSNCPLLAQTVPADGCADAPFFSQALLNGFQGDVTGYTPGSVNSFCGSAELDLWLLVRAASSTVTASVTPSNCSDGNGMQLALYPACGEQFIACNAGCSGCGVATQSITATVVPGQFYRLMLDGWAGDKCSFTLHGSGFSNVEGADSLALIEGRVVIDQDMDCHAQPAETGLQHWLVELPGTQPLFATTDATGHFALATDHAGPQQLVLHKPIFGQTYWAACEDTLTVVVPPAFQSVEADFAIDKLVNCTTNTYHTGLHAFGQRPCGPVFLKGYIENFGNQPAASVEYAVVLDPLLALDSTEFPVKWQHGDTLGFSAGPMGVGGWTWFRLYAHLPCDASLVGHSFCNQLLVFGSSDCDTLIDWSGASIAVSGSCDTAAGMVNFLIQNRGKGPTTEPVSYLIIEDEVVLKDGWIHENFLPGEQITIGSAASGQTFFIQTGQEPGHPGLSMPSAFIEGCGGPIISPLANQLPHDDSDPQIDIDCRTITFSLDPNAKSAEPTGLTGAWHLIQPGGDLEYTIEFQNTGTDTAFSVVIRDTISPMLDLATLRMEGASHPFNWEIHGPGILRVWFPGIRLVDSLTNEAASKGFVKFRIGQRPDVELYSQVFNRAAILFDQNAPILTNEVWHTIGYGFFLTGATRPVREPFSVKISPNPFHEKAVLEILSAPSGTRSLRVFTPDGRACRTVFFEGDSVVVERAGLPTGMLFFSIEVDGEILAAGRLAPK